MKKRVLLIAVLMVAAICIVVCGRVWLPRKLKSISCGNFMSSICLGMRIWREDNTNAFPENFTVMSNELATPKVLICPSDHIRNASTNWDSPVRSSYELLTTGTNEVTLDTPVLRCTMHGHIGYADGTVFDGQRRRTKWPM